MYIEIHMELKDEATRKRVANILGYGGFNTSFVGDKILAIYNGEVYEPLLRQVRLAAEYEIDDQKAYIIRRCLEVSGVFD